MADLLRRPARVNPDGPAWRFIQFASVSLAGGGTLEDHTGPNETALIVLSGRASIDAGGQVFAGVGTRASVWERTPPALVLLPPGCAYSLRAGGEQTEVIVVGAEAKDASRPPRLIGPSDMLVEERGEGQTLRSVHHLLPPSADAERLILVEVYTPPGNWSSFPPHKHDTDDPPRESLLEEIYYWHLDPPTGFAVQRVYTADGSLDQTLATRDGDLVLVPRGYHVTASTPGHWSYYLNAMAGIGRAWNFSLDPAYASLLNWQKPPGT
jgi:5-deoxy-glucuronate isomerase